MTLGEVCCSVLPSITVINMFTSASVPALTFNVHSRFKIQLQHFELSSFSTAHAILSYA